MKYLKYFNIKESQLNNKPLITYHGTSTVYEDEIKKYGLKSPYLASSYDLAYYYAETEVEEKGGDPIVYEVTIKNTNNLRYDDAAMSEPVLFDKADAQRGWDKAEKDHPEWVNKDIISVPDNEYKYSWDYVGSAWYDGVIPFSDLCVL